MPGVTALLLVHRSAQETVASMSNIVQIDRSAVLKVAEDLKLKLQEIKDAAEYTPLPIKFENLEAEVAFMAIYRLLDFGSGWDAMLQASMKRDAKEMMQFGALGMHLGAERMDHHWMSAFSTLSVHNFFGIESHIDKPMANLPGVTVSEPRQVQESGNALQQLGQRSFGSLILSILDAQKASGRQCLASPLIDKLADSIPGFRDVSCCSTGELDSGVVFQRKAQLLAADLFYRFRMEDPRFDFSDMSLLASDSGSVLQPVLRSLGVLLYSPELASQVDGGEELAVGTKEELALRCAAVAAADSLVEASGSVFTAYEISQFWKLECEDASAPMEGAGPRHSTKTTAY